MSKKMNLMFFVGEGLELFAPTTDGLTVVPETIRFRPQPEVTYEGCVVYQDRNTGTWYAEAHPDWTAAAAFIVEGQVEMNDWGRPYVAYEGRWYMLPFPGFTAVAGTPVKVALQEVWYEQRWSFRAVPLRIGATAESKKKEGEPVVVKAAPPVKKVAPPRQPKKPERSNENDGAVREERTLKFEKDRDGVFAETKGPKGNDLVVILRRGLEAPELGVDIVCVVMFNPRYKTGLVVEYKTTVAPATDTAATVKLADAPVEGTVAMTGSDTTAGEVNETKPAGSENPAEVLPTAAAVPAQSTVQQQLVAAQLKLAGIKDQRSATARFQAREVARLERLAALETQLQNQGATSN